MKKLVYETDLNADLSLVFNTIINYKDYSWRSDLKEVREIEAGKFEEVKKNGTINKIKETFIKSNVQYEYNIDSKRYRGHTTIQFTGDQNQTHLFFTQFIVPKNPFGTFILLIPRTNSFIEQYFKDLKKKVEGKNNG